MKKADQKRLGRVIPRESLSLRYFTDEELFAFIEVFRDKPRYTYPRETVTRLLLTMVKWQDDDVKEKGKNTI